MTVRDATGHILENIFGYKLRRLNFEKLFKQNVGEFLSLLFLVNNMLVSGEYKLVLLDNTKDCIG